MENLKFSLLLGLNADLLMTFSFVSLLSNIQVQKHHYNIFFSKLCKSFVTWFFTQVKTNIDIEFYHLVFFMVKKI